MNQCRFEGEWGKGTRGEPLPLGEVHLWRLSLGDIESVPPQLWSVLCEQEQVRAQRFVRLQDQCRFVAVRGMLRRLLAQYLNRDAAGLNFQYGPQGKPELVHLPGELDLRFNVSHSQDLAILAMAVGQAVGVDLEGMKARVDYRGIARRFFTAAEFQGVQSGGAEEGYGRFFQIWTRKEAVVKAMGGSIAMGLERVDVSVDLDRSQVVIQVPTEMGQLQQWMLYEVQVETGYRAALVSERPLKVIRTQSIEYFD